MAFLFLRFYMTMLLQLGVYYACMCNYCAQVYTVQTTQRSQAFLQNKKELYAEGIEKQYIFTV